MRIGIDYTAAVRQSAGIGRYCRELVKALALLDRTNEYLLLIAGKLPEEDLKALQADWRPYPNFRFKFLPLSERWLNRLWHRLRLPWPIEGFTGSLDLFHSPDFTLPPVWRARKVLTVHDLSFLRTPEYADPRLQRFLKRAVPYSVRRADLILADSQHTKQDIISLLGTAAERVIVILPGVDSRFQPISDACELERVRTKYGLTGPFILGLGMLEPRKNFQGLVEAYHLLRLQGIVSHQLVIGGRKGWMYEGIFRSVAELGLQDQVRFLGYVADEDLPALYTLADVFVFPSFYEGFGLPVLEAMACGTPVIASNAASLPEVVGEAGILVAPEDTLALATALQQVLSDQALRETLRARGREQAARFTWKRAAQQLLLAYQHV